MTDTDPQPEFTAADLIAALRSAGEERDKLHRKELAAVERIRENADFHLGQEMARRQLAEQRAAALDAVVARLRQMTDHWEQQLPEVIRTPAVVSAIRAVLERAETEPSAPVDRAALRDLAADALADAEGWQWAPGYDKAQSPTYQHYLRQADAVLAVLFGPIPAGTDVATWTAIRAIQLMNEAGRQRDAAPSAPADQTALRDRIAAAIWERQNPGRRWADCEYRWRADAEADADAVLAVLPEPADRAAIYREVADRLAADAEQGEKEGFTRIYRRSAARQVREWAGEAQQPETQAEDRAAIIAEILPTWEAVYEPGNVSDYLIGYANSEAGAKGAAEAWLRSEKDEPGRLEWVPQTPLDGYDQESELIERHDDGIDTGPGITVRHRTQKPSP